MTHKSRQENEQSARYPYQNGSHTKGPTMSCTSFFFSTRYAKGTYTHVIVHVKKGTKKTAPAAYCTNVERQKVWFAYNVEP